MSATVLGDGHSSELVESNFIIGSPQVHLHFLDDERHSLLEICCHGCGESLLIFYDDERDQVEKCVELRDSFIQQHKGCPNHDYEHWCPDVRVKINTMDLRKKKVPRQAAVPSRRQTHHDHRDKGLEDHPRSPAEQERRDAESVWAQEGGRT